MKSAHAILGSILCGLLMVASAGCANHAGQNSGQVEGYPIASPVTTTLQRTVVPDAIPAGSQKIRVDEIAKYQANGYGSWHYGPGLESVKRLDIMSPAYTGDSATHAARLLHFFAITDIHITDKECPAQAIYIGLKDGVSSAYSPIMLYTTHVLDAAVQTVNAIHKRDPIDFGLSLGDTCNCTQYNELRWYVDVLDGKRINPDSGVKDDPIPGPHNDYQDEYQAAGLDKAIPWYQALGNHDQFWMGSYPVTDYLRLAYTGENILNMGDTFIDPAGINSRGLYMGALDGRTVYGDIMGAGPVADFKTPPKVPADPNRRSLLRREWMAEFFKTSSSPVGHGFTQANLDKDFACYTFQPKSAIPIKVIVLDDTQKDSDPDLGGRKTGYGHGSLDKQRYDWLISELDKGQAQGQLMIIAAHIPIGVEQEDSYVGWSSKSYVRENALIAKLHTYPNLILWAAGHRHVNVVTAFKSPDPAHPEQGFWEIETSSLRDFPQQFRTFEIIRNGDKTISIVTTDVDPAVKDGSFAAISRSYGVAAQQFYKNKLPLLPTASYNAELIKQLSPEMQAKIQNAGTPDRK